MTRPRRSARARDEPGPGFHISLSTGAPRYADAALPMKSHPWMRLDLRSRALPALFASAFAISSAQPRPEDKALPPAPPVRVDLKYDFGPGRAADGYTHVEAGDIYTSQRGYGFDFSSVPTGVDRGGDDPRRDGFVTADKPPFLFSVKVPEGNYRVTVTLGDPRGDSNTTIRTEAGHIMAADIVTKRRRHGDAHILCKRPAPRDPTATSAECTGRHDCTYVSRRRGRVARVGRETHGRVQRHSAVPRDHGGREG